MSFLARSLALLRGPPQTTLPLRPLLLASTPTTAAPPSSSCSSHFSGRPTLRPAASIARPQPSTTSRTFTTTPHPQKRVSGKLNPNKAKGTDQKIYILRRYRAKRLPAPLRMGRNRYLRHWTIHRAWHLYQRQERQRRRDELMRMQQGIAGALEELRKTSGPGTKSEGYLYRLAIMKTKVWGMNAIPIEYARTQVETPPRAAWNHDWTKPEY